MYRDYSRWPHCKQPGGEKIRNVLSKNFGETEVNLENQKGDECFTFRNPSDNKAS